MWAETSQDSPRTFGSKLSFLHIIFPWQCLLFYPQVDILWPLPLLVWVFNCYFSSFFSTRKLFARPYEIHYPAIASQVRGRWSSCPVLLLNLRSRVLNPCSWSTGHGCIWASSNRGTSLSLLLTALDLANCSRLESVLLLNDRCFSSRELKVINKILLRYCYFSCRLFDPLCFSLLNSWHRPISKHKKIVSKHFDCFT